MMLAKFSYFFVDTLDAIYLKIAGRYPSEEEVAVFENYFEQSKTKNSYNLIYNVCHILISSSSFIYIN